jgi:ATP-binding cassette, subfamily B, heavy metal transporter
MRSHETTPRPPAAPVAPHSAAIPGRSEKQATKDWQTLRKLFPYLWAYRWRVLIALGCMVCAKLSNLGVPIILKHLVDALTPTSTALGAGGVSAAQVTQIALVVPVALILAYGALRLSMTVFTELREFVFAKVTQSAVRKIALEVFGHLHNLSLRFHLERQTGGLTRDIERGTRGVSSLVSYSLYSILPTLIEIAMVLTYLVLKYEVWFAVITITALVSYIAFTVLVTEWRTNFRKQMNDLDSKANTRAVDSLLNYETVKYFGNEEFEAKRYDESMQRWMRAAIKSQTSLSFLNVGQSCIIAIAVTLMVWRATTGVVEGRMSVGDLVLVNAFMIQLYIPLNFLGVLYREIKQSLTDMDKLFGLLEANKEVADAPNAPELKLAQRVVSQDLAKREPLIPGAAGNKTSAVDTVVATTRFASGPEIRFERVDFGYNRDRQILKKLSFTIAPGTTTAVVGASGAGKSTLARLLYRFYDVNEGRILIDGQDIKTVTQKSLRQAIGIVPQDTVLFNDTLRYNLAYGRPGCTQAEIDEAVAAAQLDGFIQTVPTGYETMVGERGLKLSGGEKQRVAIARMLLKNPPILILDEATSALDTQNEQAIQDALRNLAARRTTLVIAHRLSTIVDADQILVMEQGEVLELGTHAELLAREGRYAAMWEAQSQSNLDVSVQD